MNPSTTTEAIQGHRHADLDDLDDLLTALLKTARDSRPADSEAATDARTLRAEILRRFG